MALTITGTNGLLTRLGLMGGQIQGILNGQGNISLTVPAKSAGTAYTGLLAQFTDSTKQSDVFDGYASIVNALRQKVPQLGNIKQMAQTLLVRQVNDDVPLKSKSVAYAWAELMRQMATSSLLDSKVSPCAVAATTPTSLTGVTNTGTAVCLSSKIGPFLPGTTTGSNAMDLQFLIPETVTLKCTADAQSGGQSAYQERFSILGQPAANGTDPLVWNFTTLYGATIGSGSGANGSDYVCNAAVYQNSGVGGNLLNNGDFVTLVANLPSQWTRNTGTAGTDFLDGASGLVNTAHSLAITGNGTAASLQQAFNSSAGSTVAITPNTVYALNLWAKCTSSSAGNLLLSLVDGAGTVINDNNGVANTLTQATSGIGTSYANYGTFFRTPAVLPSTGVFLRLSVSAALGVGKTLNISTMAMQAPPAIYLGGPYIALFSGLTPSIAGDTYVAAFTNDYGAVGSGKVNLGTLLNWLFDLRVSGLIHAPIVGTTLVADSLIS